MESKLKALKVVDLKDILAKAHVTVTGKANKQDLITKILASPEAVAVYNENYGPAPIDSVQDVSAAPAGASAKSQAPPKAVAPSSSKQAKTTATSAPASKPASKSAPKPDVVPASTPKPSETSAVAVDASKASVDDEAEKRKARAARFGIPLVESTVQATPMQKNGKAARDGKAAKGASLVDDPEKLAARAARFGMIDKRIKTNGKKRPAPPSEPVDDEELARRKKRAERFGTSGVGA